MKVLVVGLGYFSEFHLSAWSSLDGIDAVYATDPKPERCAWATEFGAKAFPSLEPALQAAPDIVDIVAPPTAHLDLIRACASRGRVLVCQKPFCTSVSEAQQAIDVATAQGARLIVHENFRFQPWHRTIKAFLDEGRLGQVYSARFNLRPGDGRGAEAYLARQPAFQSMNRFLFHETGVHFVDLFRWFFGEIQSVYAEAEQLNPAIAGEDAGVLLMTHANGVRSVFDGNRLMDHATDNPRRTMGEMWIEGEAGTLALTGGGNVLFRPFAQQDWQAIPVLGDIDDAAFGGGCVAALIAHVAAGVQSGVFENEATEYVPVMRVVDAAYLSVQEGRRITL